MLGLFDNLSLSLCFHLFLYLFVSLSWRFGNWLTVRNPTIFLTTFQNQRLFGVRAGPWRLSGQCVPFPPEVGGGLVEQWGTMGRARHWSPTMGSNGPAGRPGFWPITATAATSGARREELPTPPTSQDNTKISSLCIFVFVYYLNLSTTRIYPTHLPAYH